MPASDDELTVMANEELDAACAMPFVEVRKITPWGDSYEGFAPSGRTVEVERRYLWAVEPEGGVIVGSRSATAPPAPAPRPAPC
ncbi:hypothetical protein [uncultured Brevundimonas sp.]|uniref:hypothetical protein n=1 Tax=uncultured Brevundimonas sp. TaxID=213418 RepID=UPI0025DA79A3|nr:hypothetical protein [uncultured Brevundimonas sp.]